MFTTFVFCNCGYFLVTCICLSFPLTSYQKEAPHTNKKNDLLCETERTRERERERERGDEREREL